MLQTDHHKLKGLPNEHLNLSKSWQLHFKFAGEYSRLLEMDMSAGSKHDRNVTVLISLSQIQFPHHTV